MEDFLKMRKTEMQKAYDELKQVNAELLVALQQANTCDLLKQTHRNYCAFFNTIDDLLCVLNKNGNIVHVNDTVVKRLGYSREDIVGKSILMLFPKERRDEALHIIGEILKGNSLFCPVPLVLKDGNQMPVETHVNPGIWNGQDVLFAVTKDISQIKLSEEKFSKAFQINPSGCGLSDIETGVYVEVNDSFCRLFGFDREEVIGKTAMELGILSEEVRASILQNHTGVINNKEVDLRAKDGSVKRVLLSADTLYVQDRKMRYTVVHDVTEYRQAQEALRVSERKYRLLFENMSPGFALYEMIYGDDEQVIDCRIIQTNTTFEQIAALPADNLIGRTVKDLWPHIEAHWIESYNKVAQTGEPLSFEHYSRILNRYYEVRAFSPVPHFVGMLFADITERKLYETDLKAAKEKAEENERLKSAFLANMSHEIRTPMNGILGFADLLKEPELTSEEQQRYITIIEQSGHRLLNIINDLIAISKAESGQMKVSLSETNVNEQLEFINNFFKLEASQKGIQLSLTCPLSNKQAVITTDREKLYAVLTNLMKNAIKFTDNGHISFGYEQRPGLLLFYVKDTGMGIPEEKLTIVFERFQQVQMGLSRSHEGAGLGLSISKAYVEMLGGTIWVESEEGKGSQFYFTLPYAGNL